MGEAGNLGPMRQIWSKPVTIIYGTTSSSAQDKQTYMDSAVQLSAAWRATVRGNVRIVSDSSWLQHKCVEDCQPEHLLLLGSPRSNAVVAQAPFWKSMFHGSDPS